MLVGARYRAHKKSASFGVLSYCYVWIFLANCVCVCACVCVCEEVLLVLTFLPEYGQYAEHATETVLFHIYEVYSVPQLQVCLNN